MPDTALSEHGLSRTVYSLVFPETQALVDDLWRERPAAMYRGPHGTRQADAHLALLEAWARWACPVTGVDGSGLAALGYTHRYTASGSTEAIREVLVRSRLEGARQIHVFDGEYEGYGLLAEGYGMRVVQHSREHYSESLRAAEPGDTFCLSAPSAIDGNCWPGLPAFLGHLEMRHPTVRLLLDLAYVGSTGGQSPIPLDSPVIDTLVWSLSKPFGVYYHRIGGVFARRPLTGLEGNRWFKNLFSLELGCRLLNQSTPASTAARYRALQGRAVRRANAELALGLVASDVVLLANAPAERDMRLTDYVRTTMTPHPRARLCLTPLMEQILAEAEPDLAMTPTRLELQYA